MTQSSLSPSTGYGSTIATIALLMLAVEILIMLGFYWFDVQLPDWKLALLDAALLAFIVAAVAYFAFVRPKDRKIRAIMAELEEAKLDAEVKLADFGIAKATNLPGSIQSNALKGKVPYMSPEYALGRSCGPRSDLFSLGVLLYECLVGYRPFDGENDIQTLERARGGLHVPLHEAAPPTPEPLADAIESLLAASPEQRPPNAGAFLGMLTQAPPPPLAQRDLGMLVRSFERLDTNTSAPGLASTRPALTRRPRKRLPSLR